MKKQKKNIQPNKTQSFKCIYCDNIYLMTAQNFSLHHLKKIHNKKYEQYILDQNYNGVLPFCLCGCNKIIPTVRAKYFRGHVSKEDRKKICKKSHENRIITDEMKRRYRELRLEQIKRFGGRLQIGKNEKILLDLEETSQYGIFEKSNRNYTTSWQFSNAYIQLLGLKYKILRQYELSKLGYIVDGYCKETNTVYEVYEPFHYFSKEKIQKDIRRQKEIEEYLKCKFVIIPDTYAILDAYNK